MRTGCLLFQRHLEQSGKKKKKEKKQQLSHAGPNFVSVSFKKKKKKKQQ